MFHRRLDTNKQTNKLVNKVFNWIRHEQAERTGSGDLNVPRCCILYIFSRQRRVSWITPTPSSGLATRLKTRILLRGFTPNTLTNTHTFKMGLVLHQKDVKTLCINPPLYIYKYIYISGLQKRPKRVGEDFFIQKCLRWFQNKSRDLKKNETRAFKNKARAFKSRMCV